MPNLLSTDDCTFRNLFRLFVCGSQMVLHQTFDFLRTILSKQQYTALTQKMFTLSSKTSLPHALFTAKHPQKTSSKKRCATTKAVVNDSPRIIVENDAETKKFRLRDHQREVIRDMSGFAGGEVRII